MSIIPKCVTFEQAKLLKEKGFDEPTNYYYYVDGKINTQKDKYHKGRLVDRNIYEHQYAVPEQWMVIEWLRVVHNIWIEVHGWTKQPVGDEIWEHCYQSFVNGDATDVSIFKTPQEAYSVAFDYVLNNLI